MEAIIAKTDLNMCPRWSDNIKDEWINPLLSQACEYSFYDTISQGLYNAMLTFYNEWNENVFDLADSYVLNDYTLYSGSIYKCILGYSGPTTDTPPQDPTHWQISELGNFYYQFARPYLVYKAYQKFLLWHGKHIAQSGFRKHTDNTSFEISSDELGYIMGDVRGVISVKETKMLNELNTKDYTFDTVIYLKNENVKESRGGIQIFGV
jgi:hypothetical protein